MVSGKAFAGTSTADKRFEVLRRRRRKSGISI
jgi:hypothetical protein